MSNVALIVNNVLTDSGTTLASKADLVNGLVPASQLPSYVDDVLEFANLAAFPATGETAKIYVALDTNETYRWSGSAYVRVANGAVQSVNSLTGNVTLTTANIGENTNLYFTNTRARSAISVSGSLSYDSGTGVISYTTPSTSGIAEGTNLYYTNTRARAALSFVAGSGAYNSTTGVITIPTNTNQLTNGAGFITGYTETDPYRVTAVSVSGTSTKTITITRADSSTVTTTWTDYDTDTNTYVTSASFSGGTLTLTRNDSGTVSVSLDGRYLQSYTETDTLASVTGRGASTTTRTTFTEVGVTRNGADTVADGPWFRWTNAATDRQMLTQLNASNGLTTWSYNGTAWSSIFTLTQAGNVGITISNPANKLQIGSVGSSGYGGNDIAIGNGTQVMAFYQSSTASTWYTNTSFSLMPSGAGATGNLGIGTSNPTYTLHVSGTGYFNSTLYVNGQTTLDDQVNITSGYSINFGTSRLHSTDTSYFLGGNVGINTSSPTLGKLQITGDNNQLAVHTTGTYSSIYFYNGGTDRAGIYVSNTETHFEGRGSGGLFFGGAVSQNHMAITSVGNVGIGTVSPSFGLHVNRNQNQVAGFESPNANTWIDLISTAGTWSMGATSGNTWAIYQRGAVNQTRFEVGASSASLYGNTVLHAGNYTSYALTSDTDSEQQVGGRYYYFNDGVRRMNMDPRWNESGYDSDLGTLHIWAWTAGGAAYGRAGIALYNGSAYQYLTTKASTTGLFVNNTQIVTNSGTWSINVSGSAGSTQTLALTSLGSGSVNVNNSNTAVYRTETGSGAVLAYAPVLHIGGGDTMWQMQGSYGTSGNGTLYFRQGYSGSWGNWLTMLSSANYSSYALPLSGGTLTGPVSLNNSSYFVGSSSYGFRFNNAADTANNMTLTNANSDLYVRGQVYVGGNGSNTGTQLVYNSGTWGINVTGSAGSLSNMNISQFTNNSGYITSTNSDFTYNATLTISTSWQNTGVSNSNLTSNGVYIVTVLANDAAVAGYQYSVTHVGIMYWYAGSTNGENYAEIPLHHMGHADNDRYFYLRTKTTTSGAGSFLQIRGNYTTNGNSTYTFTFKRLL